MRPDIVSALVAKDARMFVRNRFFALITVLALVIYVAIFFVMPATVDETLEVAVYAPATLPFHEYLEMDGVSATPLESEDLVREAVLDGRFRAGLALPDDFMETLTAGQKPEVRVYLRADVPEELAPALETLVKEVAFAGMGQPPGVELVQEVLGPDLVGQQVPPRDRLRSLLVVFLLMFETMALASLITEETERRTVKALLVTPASVKDFFASKGLVGAGLAFLQAGLFMAVVGGFAREPLIILVALMLGAVLVTGIGFLIASLSKDMMSVMAWGIVSLLILAMPGFGVMFPGTISGWVEVIPSYYLADTVHTVADLGAGWGDVWRNLVILAAFDLAFLTAGVTALSRRFR